jgi:hypothetical protein
VLDISPLVRLGGTVLGGLPLVGTPVPLDKPLPPLGKYLIGVATAPDTKYTGYQTRYFALRDARFRRFPSDVAP